MGYHVVDPGEMIPLAYHYRDEQVVAEGNVFVAELGSPHRAFVPEDANEPNP